MHVHVYLSPLNMKPNSSWQCRVPLLVVCTVYICMKRGTIYIYIYIYIYIFFFFFFFFFWWLNV